MSDRETNPVTRLHNLCDALSEQMDGSAFSREEWMRIDAENARLRGLLQAAKAVAYSNGFDAAYPEKLEALKAACKAMEG